MRPRITEVGEHPVAHVLGDMAVPLLHPFGAAFLIGPDQRAHVFGIEPRRQFGRAHQIAEHHRQLPPLGRGSRARRAGTVGLDRRLGVAQPCDRVQQLLAMAERGDAEFSQVIGAEGMQDASVDVVVAECLGIAFQAQFAQPGGDVHSCASDRLEWSRPYQKTTRGGEDFACPELPFSMRLATRGSCRADQWPSRV